MTRIISGFAGSRELKVPKNGTRPTSDRVREAIFSALESRDSLEGARVLDLYAGSGALGLEALSRGAAHVDLVEKNPQAAALCRSNGEIVSRSGGATAGSLRTHAQAVQNFLSSAQSTWDVVFIDPPYEQTNAELSQALETLVPLLAEQAEVVVERSARTAAFDIPQGLELVKHKNYGETVIYWLTSN